MFYSFQHYTRGENKIGIRDSSSFLQVKFVNRDPWHNSSKIKHHHSRAATLKTQSRTEDLPRDQEDLVSVVQSSLSLDRESEEAAWSPEILPSVLSLPQKFSHLFPGR